jgi:hypothetical protein
MNKHPPNTHTNNQHKFASAKETTKRVREKEKILLDRFKKPRC